MDPSRLIVYLLICILAIGFFAGVEIAFVAAHRLNIELKRKQGTLAGRILGGFLDRPQELTAASMVGLNLALVAYGLLMTRATDFLLAQMPAPLDNVWIHLVIDTVLATLVIVVFAELLPKALFRTKAEAVLSFLSLPIWLAFYLLYPIARVFVSASEFILKYLFNVRVNPERPVFSRVDIEGFTKGSLQGHDADGPSAMNTELFENALALVNVKVRRCMVPRNEIIAIERLASLPEVREKFIETKLSRLPVYDGTIDNIVGYVHHLDLTDEDARIDDVMHSIAPIPEAMSAVDLMGRFNKERKSIAWVVDEFGGTAGIVSMEDVLEKIFGQIRDEHDVDEYVEKQIADTEYIFSGRLELVYLNEKYGLRFPTDAAETLSGYIIASQGHIPRLKERVIVDHYEFDVLLVSPTRVESVKMRVLK